MCCIPYYHILLYKQHASKSIHKIAGACWCNGCRGGVVVVVDVFVSTKDWHDTIEVQVQVRLRVRKQVLRVGAFYVYSK